MTIAFSLCTIAALIFLWVLINEEIFNADKLERKIDSLEYELTDIKRKMAEQDVTKQK